MRNVVLLIDNLEKLRSGYARFAENVFRIVGIKGFVE